MTDASIANLKNARILIVDDQPANVALLETLLEREGYLNGRSTTDSQEALALFQQFGADLILLDLHMPRMDGHEVLRRIRASQPANVYLPILVLTADITSEAKTKALTQGATDFLAKPLDMVEVALRIRNLLETGYLYGQLHRQNQDLEKQVEARTAELSDTNRKLRSENEERLRAERKYRSLVEHLPIITYIIEFGEINRTSYISPQVEAILGYSPAEWVANPDTWRNCLHPADRDRVMNALAEADKRGEAANLEYRMVARDGRVLWIHGWSVPVEDESGAVRYAHGILEDITKGKQATEQVNYLAGLVQRVSDAILSTDIQFNIVSWNAGAALLYGWQAGEVLGQSVAKLQTNYGSESQTELINQLFQNGFWQGEVIQHSRDGRTLNIFSSVTLLRDTAGQPIGSVAINRDITGRKQAERALQQARDFAQQVIQTANVIFLQLDAAGDVVRLNPAAEEITGYTQAEIEGRNWFETLVPSDRYPEVWQEFQRITQVGQTTVIFENPIVTKSGTERHILWKNSIWRDEAGMVYTVSFGMDITERKLAEEHLSQSEARFSIIFQSSPAGISLTTPAEGRIVDANDALLKMTGYTRTQALGRTITEIGMWIEPAQREQLAKDLQERGPARSLEVKFVNLTGRVVQAVSALEMVEIGGEHYLLGMHQDITELKTRERELAALEGLSAALSRASTRAEMVPTIVDQIMSLFGAEAAALDMVDRVKEVVITQLGRGQWANKGGQITPPGQGIVGQVIATGQFYHTDDVQSDPLFNNSQEWGNLRAVVCSPLSADRQILGAICVGQTRPIEPAETRLLEAVADIAANALHRAALFEQTEQQLQRLNILRSVDQALTGSMDLQLILDVLLDQITSQLGVQAAAFLLLDSHTLVLHYAAGHGFRTKVIEQTHLRLGEGFAGRAALERRPIHIPNVVAAGSEFRRAKLFTQEGFQSYYAVPAFTKGQIKGVLEFFPQKDFVMDPNWESFVEALASQAAIAIDNTELFSGLQRSNFDLAIAYDATLEGWSRALDLRDKETEGHSRRVTEMTLRLAEAMGLEGPERINIRRGALLHDIGKLGIPDGILLKPAKLSPEEWEIMKKHPGYAYEMLLPINYLHSALDIPYCHHEKWDGTGYPRGLKGETIPLAARLFAVVDVWDALSSDRPYRPRWTPDKVRDYIQNESGKHFDPQVVTAFLRIIDNNQAL